jgi:hypothetical protein
MAPCTDPATGRVMVGRAAIHVRGGGVAVDIPISPGVPLFGEFLVTGPNGEALKTDLLDLRLRSLGKLPDAFVRDPNLIVMSERKFSAINVPEERYTFRVDRLPPEAYVEDMRQVDRETGAERSVFDDGFDLHARSNPVQIVIHTEGGTVKGTVRTPDGIPAGDATVVLVPPEDRRRNALRYKSASTDADGNFSMQGVPPGQYTAFAWESIYPTAWMNPKVLEQHKNSGRSVEVARAFPVDLQLTLIPVDIRR